MDGPPRNPEVRIPHAALDGNVWPALPVPRAQTVLAILYQFEQTQWWPAETLRHHQFRQLRSLVAHAWDAAPFHRKRLEETGLAPPFDDLADAWPMLPPLTRGDIQSAGHDIHSQFVPKDHGGISDIHTSGSTGRPIRALRTSLALRFWSAFTAREHIWHRRDTMGKLAVIRVSTPGEDEYPQGGRYRYWGSSRRAFDTGPCVSLNINASAAEQLDWLRRMNPEYLLTHPTNLLRILQLSAADGFRPPNLRDVQTLSEILRPELRALCQDVWGVPIKDNYSGREVGYIALQCPDHEHYHVQAEGALVEVIDDKGNACGPGEVGRVLVTPLHNFAMPFLRYEVGDFAEVGEACPCGRGLPVLKRIIGREQNMVSLPDGSKRWTLLSEGGIRKLLKLAPIREYQFVQKSLDEIEVRLVVERPLEAGEEDAVRQWSREKFEHPFTFTLAYLDELPRGPTGKLQDFISEIS